jgi:outer membrane protein assembly factor BamB
MKNIVCISAIVVIMVASAIADWPQFQGANRDGVSTEPVKLADTWPVEGPRVAWKMDGKLGTGFGGAVVEGGKVYLLDRVDDRKDMLRCIDLKGGKEEWAYSYFAPAEAETSEKGIGFKGGYNGSRNLPAVDAGNVYILGPYGDLNCVSKETHKALWSINLIKDYDTNLGNWGICQSPVLYKDTVIVAPLSKKAGIVAFDKATGKEAWKSECLGEIAWTSPAISTIDGVDQVVMLINRGTPGLVGVEIPTGKKLWQYNGWQCPNPIGMHTDCGLGRFFVTGGYGAGCAMVQVSKDGDAWKVTELFKSKNCGAQAVKPIFYKDFIYAKSNDTVPEGSPANGLVCLDMKGDIAWKTSSDSREELGSILIADGKIYNFSSEKGTLSMAAATNGGYKELGTVKVATGGNNWAPTAISDGKLLIRFRRTLVCLDVCAAGNSGD